MQSDILKTHREVRLNRWTLHYRRLIIYYYMEYFRAREFTFQARGPGYSLTFLGRGVIHFSGLPTCVRTFRLGNFPPRNLHYNNIREVSRLEVRARNARKSREIKLSNLSCRHQPLIPLIPLILDPWVPSNPFHFSPIVFLLFSHSPLLSSSFNTQHRVIHLIPTTWCDDCFGSLYHSHIIPFIVTCCISSSIMLFSSFIGPE